MSLRYPDCDSIRAIPHEHWEAWLLDAEEVPFNILWFYTPEEMDLFDEARRVAPKDILPEDLVYRAMVFNTMRDFAAKRVKAAKKKPKPRGWIYFIQARPGDPIKIGFAKDPEKRLRELQTGSAYPLQILAKVPGRLEDERRLHGEFTRFRLSGEWFKPAKKLLEYVEAAT
jgi:hypothetical protein